MKEGRLARGTHEALPDERNESVLVYVNGRFYRREEAKISVFDSGFLVGDGVWEGIRLHGGVRSWICTSTVSLRARRR
jgi:branched-chain amino acid aminotransferase